LLEPVLNRPFLVAWLHDRVRVPEARDLVVLALERAILRDARFMVALYDPTPGASASPTGYVFMTDRVTFGLKSQIDHVVDWVVASVVNDAPWLHRLDADGRPLKLMKIGTLDRAVKEADKAMLRMGGTASKVMSDADERLFRDLGEGWTLVRLTSPSALDRESRLMQHCIGQGAYDEAVLSEDLHFLSLRDPAGKPHTTLEIQVPTRNLFQMQGKQNRLPERRYIERMLPYLGELENDGGHLLRAGFARDRRGGLFDFSELPDSLHIEGGVFFDFSSMPTIRIPSEELIVVGRLTIIAPHGMTVVLPRVLHVTGTFETTGDFIFPDGADVRVHDAIFNRGMISTLPDDIAVRNLAIHYNGIERLPSGLTLDSLDIGMCPSMTSLPDDLTVLTSAKLWSSPLVSLGARMNVRTLNLSDLPDLLKLPEDLRTMDLVLNSTGIDRIPAAILPKSLRIEDQGMVDLPEHLSIEGSLALVSTSPRRPFSTLRVEEDLLIECDGPIDLPEGTIVGRNLELSTKGTATIRKGSGIGARAMIRDTEHLVVESDVGFGSDLWIMSISVPPVLPADLKVPNKLVVRSCDGIVIHEDMRFSSLNIDSSIGIRLPVHVDFKGSLVMVSCSLDRMLETVKIGGNLDLADCEDLVLPSGIRVTGNALFRNCKSLVVGTDAEFQSGLHVDGPEASFGEGLKVARVLTGSGIGHLPDGSRIGFFVGSDRLVRMGADCSFDNLRLVRSPMRGLPSGTTVARDLDLEDSDIDVLPEDLVVRGKIMLGSGFSAQSFPDGVDEVNIRYATGGGGW
jgi:hypothetical protein